MTEVNQQRIAKNTLLLYLRMLIVMIVALYTSRVIIDALGKEHFGIYDAVGGNCHRTAHSAKHIVKHNGCR